LHTVCRGAALEVIEILGVSRLPYRAYHRARRKFAVKSVETAEELLATGLGPTFLARELFVAARRSVDGRG
jgi:hypothetical protein